ncbi:hypothetical protein [Gorillibacterium sp. CAU 1737]|uniref:hypothetical protein n=1 Tax=Gorillibacterium sp. CAU 1737 TaxID=3140362 RepID=UPI0032602047
MKKIASLFLAVILLLSLASTSFAEASTKIDAKGVFTNESADFYKGKYKTIDELIAALEASGSSVSVKKADDSSVYTAQSLDEAAAILDPENHFLKKEPIAENQLAPQIDSGHVSPTYVPPAEYKDYTYGYNGAETRDKISVYFTMSVTTRHYSDGTIGNVRVNSFNGYANITSGAYANTTYAPMYFNFTINGGYVTVNYGGIITQRLVVAGQELTTVTNVAQSVNIYPEVH